MADTYLQYHAIEQSHTRMDPLADILNNINNNPVAYANAYTNNNNNSSAQCSQQTNNTQKGKAMNNKEQSCVVVSNDHRQEAINISKDREKMSQDCGVIKTRTRQLVKKPDRLV